MDTCKMYCASDRMNPRMGVSPAMPSTASPRSSRSISSFILTLGGILFTALTSFRLRYQRSLCGLFSTWEDTQRLFIFTGTLAHDPDFFRNVQTFKVCPELIGGSTVNWWT